MGMIVCRDCQRHRGHIELLRDRIGELELRLEGALQRERRTASSRMKDPARNDGENTSSRSLTMGSGGSSGRDGGISRSRSKVTSRAPKATLAVPLV
jgi:hypothetical protein